MTQSSSHTRTGSMLGADVRQLLANLNEMAGARRELAELEIRADVAASKRLVWQAGMGAVLVLTGLPVLVVFLAQVLHAWRPVGTSSINAWGPILAGSLMLVGLIFIWAGYRRFRREFSGLRQSMAEFREDVQWLREWTGVRDQPREE
jgi:uncharacterized membrane protein YqjE